MLKLNASYSKKVPAEGEYSSHSYHVAIELELPSNLTTNEMQDQIVDTFRLCRESVEAKLGTKNNVRQVGPKEQTKEPSSVTHENEELASSRQVSFLRYRMALFNSHNWWIFLSHILTFKPL